MFNWFRRSQFHIFKYAPSGGAWQWGFNYERCAYPSRTVRCRLELMAGRAGFILVEFRK